MNTIKGIIVIAAVMLLSACVTPPTREQLRTANYGSAPDNYQEIIKYHMKGALFDPYSAVYENWTGPVKGAYVQDYQGNTYYGHAVCVDINSKNQMGGYVGSRPYYFAIINGTIVQREGGYPPRHNGGCYGASIMRAIMFSRESSRP